MILHLLKHPVNPLALQVLNSDSAEESLVAVLLPPGGDLPQLSGIKVYRVTDSSSTGNGESISYSRLVEMVFAADKVVAW